jgi:hypothetical protein
MALAPLGGSDAQLRGSAASLRGAPATASQLLFLRPGAHPLSPNLRPPSGGQAGSAGGTAGSGYVNFASATTGTSTSTYPAQVEPDWQVLVLFADETDKDIKGIWGPYTNVDMAAAALDELRQWPLDGRWDMRRLNKFVARKAGNEPNQLMRWSWQS